MQVVCERGCGTLTWNPKRDCRLAALSCPLCGGRYRKSVVHARPADPGEVEARVVALRFERAVHRLADVIDSARDLAPALSDLGRSLSGIRRLRRLVRTGGAQ